MKDKCPKCGTDKYSNILNHEGVAYCCGSLTERGVFTYTSHRCKDRQIVSLTKQVSNCKALAKKLEEAEELFKCIQAVATNVKELIDENKFTFSEAFCSLKISIDANVEAFLANSPQAEFAGSISGTKTKPYICPACGNYAHPHDLAYYGTCVDCKINESKREPK